MTFRIATWNLDHASRSNRPIPAQTEKIRTIKADVLILTETCKEVDLSDLYGSTVVSASPNKYKKYFSAIWTRWPVVRRFDTNDNETATCVQIQSPFGDLI